MDLHPGFVFRNLQHLSPGIIATNQHEAQGGKEHVWFNSTQIEREETQTSLQLLAEP